MLGRGGRVVFSPSSMDRRPLLMLLAAGGRASSARTAAERKEVDGGMWGVVHRAGRFMVARLHAWGRPHSRGEGFAGGAACDRAGAEGGLIYGSGHGSRDHPQSTALSDERIAGGTDGRIGDDGHAGGHADGRAGGRADEGHAMTTVSVPQHTPRTFRRRKRGKSC